MYLILSRKEIRSDGVFGEITDARGNFICVTLEHAFPISQVAEYESKIPNGNYLCKKRMSPKFGYEVFELIDVPGHDFIEIHIGNYNEDSDGCILLGVGMGHKNNGGKMIMNSKVAFEKFMKMMQYIDSFYLMVE